MAMGAPISERNVQSCAPSFSSVFGFPPEETASAPGRVNLLGEHTDYSQGYVLPVALRQSTTVDVARSRDGAHHLSSTALAGVISFSAENAVQSKGFASYVYGCIEVLRERGSQIGPVTIFVDSTVPIGSGLSSSAALEIAVLRALRKLYRLALSDVELALLGIDAERRYAHVNCGVMDQMVSSLGDAAHMLFLDTRSLERKLLPLPAADLIVLDSGTPRQLANSGYNRRRAECEAAASALGLVSLRDAESLPNQVEQLTPPLNRRARHVIRENARVLEAARGVDAAHFGRLMNASHASLRDDFEVSAPALDALVAILQADTDVYGAKLTGAGFGGACVALTRPGAGDAAAGRALQAYAADWPGGSRLV